MFRILQFGKLTNLSIFLAFVNFEIRNIWHSKILLSKMLTFISENFQFEKLADFPIYYNWRIWKIIKFV